MANKLNENPEGSEKIAFKRNDVHNKEENPFYTTDYDLIK